MHKHAVVELLANKITSVYKSQEIGLARRRGGQVANDSKLFKYLKL